MSAGLVESIGVVDPKHAHYRKSLGFSAAELVERIGGIHGSAGDKTPLLVTVTALSIVASDLTAIHAFRDVMALLPLIVLPLAALHWRTRRAGAALWIPVGLVALLVWSMLSYVWSADPPKSLHLILEFVSAGAVGAIVAAVLEPREILKSVSISGKAIIAMSWADVVVHYHTATTPPPGDPIGWHALFGQKNGLGFAMAVSLIAIGCDRSGKRWVWGLWLVLGAVLLRESHSGAGLSVTLAVCSLVVWLSLLRNTFQPSTRAALKVLSIGLTLAAAACLALDFSTATAILGKNATLTGRTRIWGAVLHAITQNPILGYGYGGVWADASGETGRLWRAIGFPVYEAHEQYLDVLLQLGAIGAVLLLCVLLAAWRRTLVGIRSSDGCQRWLLYMVFAFSLEGVVESAMFGFDILLVAAVVGAALVRDRAGVPVQRLRVGTAPGPVEGTR